MATKPSQTNTIELGDSIVLYKANQGDYRTIPVSDALNAFESVFNFPDIEISPFLTQYATPAATGFSVEIASTGQSTHLILTPVAGYAAGTIVLPAVAGLVDKQEILVNCTQAVTTLTVNGNGRTVVGAPTTLAANAFFRLKYDSFTQNWYRVG